MRDLENDEELETGEEVDYPDTLSGGLRRRTPHAIHATHAMMTLPRELDQAKSVIKESYPMANFSPPVWDHDKRQTALVVIDVAGDLESLQNILSTCPECHFRIVNSKLMLVHTEGLHDDEVTKNYGSTTKDVYWTVKLGILVFTMAFMILVIVNVFSKSNFRVLFD